MPFTPLHLGPALAVGCVTRRWIHWPTLILASVVVDVEPLLVLVLGAAGYPLHGYLHTFAASLAAGLVLGYAMRASSRFLERFFENLALMEGSVKREGYAAAGIAGWTLHVLLDSPLYSDIRPLYPLQLNPLYSPAAGGTIFALCSMLLAVGIGAYLLNLYRVFSLKAGRLQAAAKTGFTSLATGVASLALTLVNPLFDALSLLLISGGVALLYSSLTGLVAKHRRRILCSAAFTAVSLAAFTIALVLLHHIPPHRRPIGAVQGFALAIYFAWFTALAGLLLLRKPLKSLASGLYGKTFARAVDVLIAGWLSTPLIVGVPVVVAALTVAAAYFPEQPGCQARP